MPVLPGLYPESSSHFVLLPCLTSSSSDCASKSTFIHVDQVSSKFQMYVSLWISYRNCKLVLPQSRTVISPPESALSHMPWLLDSGNRPVTPCPVDSFPTISLHPNHPALVHAPIVSFPDRSKSLINCSPQI